jgi:CBS domain-containing protein
MILARDIMSRSVITISMDMDLQSASLVFATHGISGAPVVDSDRMLVGVISARDIVRHQARLLAESSSGTSQKLTRDELETLAELRHDFEAQRGSQLKIMDIMTPYAVSASEETPAVELAQIMCREKVHRVLILEEGRLTGIVSSMDIVRAVANCPLGDILREGRPDRRALRKAVKRNDAKPKKPAKKPAPKKKTTRRR